MTLRLGDLAPDFDAETTEGRIRFHDWIGESWAVLFSHPKNYTPVCTTELGYMAKIKPEFDRRGVKIIGLSVDPVAEHAGWTSDIGATQGTAPNYPLIGDADYTISKLYDMLPANASGDPAQRSAANNQTVRNVFVIGPDKKIKLILVYPMTTGLRRGAARHRLVAADHRPQGRHTRQLATGRGRDHRRQRQRRRSPHQLPRRLARTTSIPAYRPATRDRPPATCGRRHPGGRPVVQWPEPPEPGQRERVVARAGPTGSASTSPGDATLREARFRAAGPNHRCSALCNRSSSVVRTLSAAQAT